MKEVKEVAAYVKRHGLTLVTAESCTAGLIASRLAEVPGAGKLLDCAFVVYTVSAKQRCLGVSRETIERCNLTSEAVAREMALGALNAANREQHDFCPAPEVDLKQQTIERLQAAGAQGVAPTVDGRICNAARAVPRRRTVSGATSNISPS